MVADYWTIPRLLDDPHFSMNIPLNMTRLASRIPSMRACSALALTLSVIHVNNVTSDATSHWLLGVQLIAVYVLVALTYFYL